MIHAAATKNMDKQEEGTRTVAVLGYPALYNTEVSEKDCKTFLSTDRRKDINQAAKELNDALEGAAKAVNIDPTVSKNRVVFINVDAKFFGHRICDSDQWIIGGAGFPGNHDGGFDPFSKDNPPWIAYFHPGEKGHEGMLQALEEELKKLPAGPPEDLWPGPAPIRA